MLYFRSLLVLQIHHLWSRTGTDLPCSPCWHRGSSGIRDQCEFEARSSACSAVRKQLQQLAPELQNRVEVHHTALGNRSGELNIFLARDSSSLLRSAIVGHSGAKRKAENEREKQETVPMRMWYENRCTRFEFEVLLGSRRDCSHLCCWMFL